MAGYEDSDIYKLAKQMAVEIHQMTLNELPKFEMYEQGSQIRRSSKSVVANFVEGYGRRHYKAEYIKFLTYALASCDEAKTHLELLHELAHYNLNVSNTFLLTIAKSVGCSITCASPLPRGLLANVICNLLLATCLPMYPNPRA
jgi:four helix bundle protein